jgi:hypothetical protein
MLSRPKARLGLGIAQTNWSPKALYWRMGREVPKSDIRHETSLSRQLGEKHFGFFQIERIEAFGEPVVDRREQFASLLPLTLVAPEPREAHCSAEFPQFRLLLTGKRKCLLKRGFRLVVQPRPMGNEQLSLKAKQFRFIPPLAGRLGRRQPFGG